MQQNNNNNKRPKHLDIAKACEVIAQQVDKITEQRISKAEFDKSYYGLISKVHFNSDTPKKTKEYQLYSIRYNGYEQDVYIRDGIIHSVGDRVMVTLPNGKLSDKFVRVLTPNQYPVTMELSEDGSKITETQVNSVGEKLVSEFLIEKDSNGRITSITFPDGSVMNVKGF